MSMENPAQGTPEEIKKAEGGLNSEEKYLSSKRESLFDKLTVENKELLKQCDLHISEPVNGIGTLKGSIKGHSIFIEIPENNGKIATGLVDGLEISADQANELFNKYYYIAVAQTEGSKGKLSDKDLKELKKKVADNLVEELL